MPVLRRASLKLAGSRTFTGEFWLALSGIASVVFAFLVMMNPASGALAIAWLIGWHALFLGAMLVMLSIKLHNIAGLEICREENTNEQRNG